MRAAQPLLDSKVMRWFDRWTRRSTPVTLVLSGSALSLMEGLTEGNQPLFGRASYRPLIEPLHFRDAAEFGPGKANPEQRLRRYAVLGGTPQYQDWAGEAELGAILREHILRRGEPLYEEPLQLLRGEDEIRDPGSYYSVLLAISAGATGASEIASRIGGDGGRGGRGGGRPSMTLLTKRLRRLKELGYIEQRRPLLGNGVTRWEILDPYFAFWFRYVYPARSRLQIGGVEAVAKAIEADLDNFMGPVFERVCREWAARVSAHESLAGAEALGSAWTRTHDLEVDLVATRGKACVALGSCKWSRQADARVLDDLLAARARLSNGLGADLFVFARGFHPSLKAAAKEHAAILVTPADLFS